MYRIIGIKLGFTPKGVLWGEELFFVQTASGALLLVQNREKNNISISNATTYVVEEALMWVSDAGCNNLCHDST